ncbi:MAG: hypothetical protein JXR94_10575 [Candidatus Hydrogenedentes bacterium]|nr:hypothetical protein [Candidatus Hydrogenedentota bacterium]
MAETDHIRKLEAEVERLTSEVQGLRARLAHEGPGGEEPVPLPQRPPRPWLNRLLLVLMTAGVGAATFTYLLNEGIAFSRFGDTANQLASIRLDYALLACACVAALAVLAYVSHRWLTFLSFAWLAVYMTYALHFAQKPGAIPGGPLTYFWMSAAFLTACYLLVASGCIRESRKRTRRGRTAAVLAWANSIAYFYYVGSGVRAHVPRYEPAFLLGFTCVLAAFAILAETSGPRRNYLFQAFVTKTIIVCTLALHAFIKGEWLWIAMAVECVVLAVAYQRSGVVVLKVLNLLLLLVTFVFCIQAVKVTDSVAIGPRQVPASWLFGTSVSGIFLFIAWFYERFTGRLGPADRRLSGHWFLADTPFDVPCATAAMIHAGAAVLILVTITIVNLGDQTALPYVLAAESVGLIVLGLLFRTPQIEVGAGLMLVAAHVCYYFFLGLDRPALDQRPYALSSAAVMAGVTYMAGFRWERCLRQIPTAGSSEHHAMAAVPCVLGSAMLATIIERGLEGAHVPVAQNVLGVVLIAAGCGLRYPPITVSGVAALAFAAGTFLTRLFSVEHPLMAQPHAVLWLALFLGGYIAAERALALAERRQGAPTPAGDATRTVIVLAAAVLGLLGLGEWAPSAQRTFCWLGLATIATIGGLLTGDGRYRWTAVLVLVVTATAAIRQDVSRLPAATLYQHLAVGAAVFVVLVSSWCYPFFRRRALRAAHADDGTGASHHE